MLKTPMLWPSVETPRAEVAAIKELYANLWGITGNLEAWAASFRLYEFAKSRPLVATATDARQWRFIAAQECVLQLHHFHERITKIKAHKLNACPSIASSIDTKMIRAAAKLFDDYFPGIDQLRHAVAHAGANDVLPEDHAPDGYLLVGFTKEDKDRFSAPYKGRDYYLDITKATQDRLGEVAAAFLRAFEPAAELLEQQGHLD